ncbi:TolC family protein [Phorcysia thermohydrogeniphila]|uniref:Outer membrane protein TolC n=1 Tax=Phorcysia thermohydrogeniphila TaxID=936138 RepID=A0A4V6NCZ8_9BACT|nr:TolC family protein [Phorcysia thermohydrogeniphila]TCK06586.1 outer membrane protein TolC [Phorcysia thermohydrogeniphila]
MRKIAAFILTLLTATSSYAVTTDELKELIDRNALGLVSERALVEKSKLSAKATLRSFFPTLSLSAGVTEFYPNQTFTSKSWEQQYTLGLSLTATPVDLRKKVQLKIDRYFVKVGEDNLNVVRLSLYYEGISALFKLKALKEKIELRKKILRNSQEILSVAEKKYKEGLVLITDVLKAESEVESARSSLSEALMEYIQTFNSLNELVDYALPEGETPEVELKKDYSVPEKEELLKKAFTLRPEVKKAEKEVKVAKLSVELQKKTLSPTVNLSASYSRSGTSFFPRENSYDLSLSLNFPVFDSGVTSLRSMAAEKDLVVKEVELKKVKNSVKTEVLNALESLKASREILKSSEAFLKFSRRSYERALNEYKLGVSDIVALLQAHENLKKAEESYIDALLKLNLSWLQLQKATGELLGGRK